MMKEGEEEEVVADWYDVQYDLLALIAEEMISFSPTDFIRLSAVCALWRSFLVENYEEIKLPNQLPILLIPRPQENQDRNQSMNIGLDEEDEEEENEDEEEEKMNAEDSHCEGDDDEEKEEGEDEESSKIINRNYDDEGVEEDEDEDDYDDVEDEVEEEEESKEWVIPRYYDPKEIFQGQDSKRYRPTRAFYSLSERKVYKDFHLSVPYYKNCVGSCKGWLVTVVEDDDFTVQLLNPFRSVNNTIQLPPLTTLDLGRPADVQDSYLMIKVVLSASPSSISNPSDLVVMGFYGTRTPAFCRPGDTSWTCFPNIGYNFDDAIYCKGQFYAIRIGRGGLVAFDVKPVAHQPLQVKVTLIAEAPAPVEHQIKKYIVESAGDLLMVRRYIRCTDDDTYYTKGFQVLKFNPLEPNKWIEMRTLEGRILFLGNTTSLSLPALDFPGCTPNCIYFTDDYFEYFVCDPTTGPHDMGVFNLENGSFEPHYLMQSKTILPPPLWIQPMI